ncbi:MAG TPA: alkaline phosphatase PhoX [Chryseosolibacter sp.]|nr:alkaline phosphatase PhoX [Chryseosolibacter sp.]
MNKSRRDFIRHTGFVSLGFLGLNQLVTTGCKPAAASGFGYGPLSYKEGDVLSLPKGFSASIISKCGQTMSDGFLSPGAHDGMGAFRGANGKTLLVRNHELTPGSYGEGPFGRNNEMVSKISRDKIYDFASGGKYMCVGGTTTMVYNEQTGKVETEYLSLVGTVRNCSGGVTPWKSWITCEETNFTKGGDNGFLEKDHGYPFEVPAREEIGLVDPVPIKAMGRFVHESAAVHPTLGIVYQTEDEGDGLLYRYLPNTVPNAYGDLQKGGKLQCLSLKEWKSADTHNGKSRKDNFFPENKPFEVEWLDLDDIDSPNGDLRLRGFQQGAAKFSSGEGITFGKNEVFFTASSGGRAGLGQIFRYVPSKYEGQAREKEAPGTLELFLESKEADAFDSCDNLTVSPWGDVVICEDKEDPRIVGVTPSGETYVIAKNIGYRDSEFTGPAFSPTGKTLFVNIQSPGLTLAITGPWRS